MEIRALGINLAKSGFQLQGVNAGGIAVLRRKLRGRAVLDLQRDLPPCLIGMEVCVNSHHWAREVAPLGHEVRLIPPVYVKPYVKQQ